MKAKSWVAAISIGFVLGVGACGGTSNKTAGARSPVVGTAAQNIKADRAAAKAAALKLSDFPSGWTARAHPNLDANSFIAEWAKCLRLPATPLAPASYLSPVFSETNSSGYTISNGVSYWPHGTGQTSFGILLSNPKTPECISTVLTALLTAHLAPGITVGRVTVSSLSLPHFGDKSKVYQVRVPISDNGDQLTAYGDVMYSAKGRARVSETFVAEGDPFPADQIQHYSQLVVNRLTNT